MKSTLFILTVLLGGVSLANAQNAGAKLGLTHSFRKEMSITGSAAFPYDTAGIVAYVQIPPNAADIRKGLKAFSQVAQLGQNYAIGTVGGENMYFDSNGWIVCYFYKGNFFSNLITTPAGPQMLNNTVLSASINALVDTLAGC